MAFLIVLGVILGSIFILGVIGVFLNNKLEQMRWSDLREYEEKKK
jgi:hypothetical protein